MNREALIASLRSQCNGPRDGALLRYALGDALLDSGDAATAAEEFRHALRFDARYSAAWKLLGKACHALNDREGAAAAWRQGMVVAQARGDKQAEKEMAVFLRRLERAAEN